MRKRFSAAEEAELERELRAYFQEDFREFDFSFQRDEAPTEDGFEQDALELEADAFLLMNGVAP